ncbi:MAG: FAD-binding protein, partial [Sciscionella sp.]|nr:FAD-binding protein [Sciscionella sp.]
MADFLALLTDIVGAANVLAGQDIPPEYAHDESLTVEPVLPAYVVLPGDANEVAAIVRVAAEHGIAVTARGSGSGMSGACVPRADGVCVSFARMNAVREIDVANQVAVVQPGVTLAELDDAAAEHGLTYPVYPGEMSGSLGGNVNTNAGGMRAVKYGVTRNNVLGLRAVLGTGELIRTGGKITKVSTGLDLTQLIIGAEGTLALVTEVTVKLRPRLPHGASLLAPFPDLSSVLDAVPKIIASGLAPHILEYLDNLTLAAISYTEKLSLGISENIRDIASAYLVVALENRDSDRLNADVEIAGELLGGLGAMDVYVLDGGSARKLIEAREKAFWTAKAAGADDIIDVVVPRSSMAEFLARTREIAAAAEAGAIGCGHAGDGNVHLGIFCEDARKRTELLHDIFAVGVELGGYISGEHGIGQAKKGYFLRLT